MFKRLFVLLLLVAATVGVSMPTPSHAAPAAYPYLTGYIIEYYSDATYAQRIGTKVRNCEGRTYTYGSTSNYYIHEGIDCSDPPV